MCSTTLVENHGPKGLPAAQGSGNAEFRHTYWQFVPVCKVQLAGHIAVMAGILDSRKSMKFYTRLYSEDYDAGVM